MNFEGIRRGNPWNPYGWIQAKPMNATAVSRYFGRAGDYACKLAEKIIFMTSGEYVVFIQE